MTTKNNFVKTRSSSPTSPHELKRSFLRQDCFLPLLPLTIPWQLKRSFFAPANISGRILKHISVEFFTPLASNRERLCQQLCNIVHQELASTKRSRSQQASTTIVLIVWDGQRQAYWRRRHNGLSWRPRNHGHACRQLTSSSWAFVSRASPFVEPWRQQAVQTMKASGTKAKVSKTCARSYMIAQGSTSLSNLLAAHAVITGPAEDFLSRKPQTSNTSGCSTTRMKDTGRIQQAG